MATVALAKPPTPAEPNGALASVVTLADLLHRLGNIAPERVRFRPLPGTATEADVIAANNRRDRPSCELIDGVLVERAMGTKESLVASLIGHLLWTYLEANDIGLALGADGMMKLWPGRVRIPDVAFISWDRLPAGELPDEAVASLAPDLAVEVLSEGNTAAEIALKLDDFFRAGTRLAWVIDPKTRTAEVYTSATAKKHVGPRGKLQGGDVLPGFSLSLMKLFARTHRNKRNP
jgi:Uma2 family endonuclease